MTKKTWIGPEPEAAVGDFGFLIEQSDPYNKLARHLLSLLPARTNREGEPLLQGWCGEWNNVSTYACGIAVVEKVAINGRCLVRELEGDDLDAALELLGFPELMPTE